MFNDYLDVHARYANSSENEVDELSEDDDGAVGNADVRAPDPLAAPAGPAGPAAAAAVAAAAPADAASLRRGRSLYSDVRPALCFLDEDDEYDEDKEQLDLLLLGEISAVISRHRPCCPYLHCCHHSSGHHRPCCPYLHCCHHSSGHHRPCCPYLHCCHHSSGHHRPCCPYLHRYHHSGHRSLLSISSLLSSF